MDNFKATVLSHLRNGATVSAVMCARWLEPSTKLTSRISELRKEGWPIQDRWLTSNGKRYKAYWMKPGAKRKVK